MKVKLHNIEWLPVFLLLVVLVTGRIHAQVNIQFAPALNGQSVNGLFTAQIQNMTAVSYSGKLKISVRDGNNKVVLLVITPPVSVHAGTNLIQSLAAQSSVHFGSSPSANIVAQTGRFPENEYEYCFEFTGAESKLNADEQVFENCFNYTVQPIIPLTLVYPGDDDELCNIRPEFTWQPAMPLVSTFRYRIIVTEKRDKQPAADAIMNNVPVFQQDNLASFMLPYPPQVPGLQKNKKYVWQVIAYEGNLKVTQSEIWKFTINCNDQKPDSSKESYRQLSISLNGNYYTAAGVIRFSLINPYSSTALQYSITDIADPTKEIGNLPAVKVQTGLNKIDIATEDVSGMQANKFYLLKVKNIGDHALYLQFIYKESEGQ